MPWLGARPQPHHRRAPSSWWLRCSRFGGPRHPLRQSSEKRLRTQQSRPGGLSLTYSQSTVLMQLKSLRSDIKPDWTHMPTHSINCKVVTFQCISRLKNPTVAIVPFWFEGMETWLGLFGEQVNTFLEKAHTRCKMKIDISTKMVDLWR